MMDKEREQLHREWADEIVSLIGGRAMAAVSLKTMLEVMPLPLKRKGCNTDTVANYVREKIGGIFLYNNMRDSNDGRFLFLSQAGLEAIETVEAP